MVWADSHYLSRGQWYSGSYLRKTSRFCIRGFHPLWRSFPATSATCRFCNFLRSRQTSPDMSLYPDVAKAAAMALRRFRLFPVRSPLLRESLSVSFPRTTKRFYFVRFGSSFEDTSLWAGGFPHSGILGSSLACSSPRLFAACHALLPFWLPQASTMDP